MKRKSNMHSRQVLILCAIAIPAFRDVPALAQQRSVESAQRSTVRVDAAHATDAESILRVAGLNCHAPVDDHNTSFSDRNYLLFAADDFVPAISQIGSVTWYGAYLDTAQGILDCGPGPGDDFQIRI